MRVLGQLDDEIEGYHCGMNTMMTLKSCCARFHDLGDITVLDFLGAFLQSESAHETRAEVPSTDDYIARCR